MALNLKEALPDTCKVTIPTHTTTVQDALPKRWCQLLDSTPPAAVVEASNEGDVVAVVKAARSRGLKVIPAGGSTGTYLVTDGKTLYLDLHRLNSVSVDEAAQTATVGGGARWKDVLDAVTPKGFYGVWTNITAVGVGGSISGGGFGPFTGRHGFSCDNVVGARVVTASGDVLDLSASAADEKERRLFNLLCGGGHGLAVVVSWTLRIYPLPSDDDAEADRVVSVTAMFPRPAFRYATALLGSLLPITGLGLHLGLMSAPPNMPPDVVGSPIIMVDAKFLGTKAKAEKILATSLLSAETKEKAIVVMTDAQPFSRATAMMDSRIRKPEPGGYLDVFNGSLVDVDVADIDKAVDAWLAYREKASPEAAARVMSNLGWLDNAAVLAADPKAERGFSRRDRRIVPQVFLYGLTKPEDVEPAAEFGRTWLELLRGADRAKGVEDAIYHNNLRPKMDMRLVYTAEKLEEVKKVKGMWDPDNVFWNPAVNPWSS